MAASRSTWTTQSSIYPVVVDPLFATARRCSSPQTAAPADWFRISVALSADGNRAIVARLATTPQPDQRRVRCASSSAGCAPLGAGGDPRRRRRRHGRRLRRARLPCRRTAAGRSLACSLMTPPPVPAPGAPASSCAPGWSWAEGTHSSPPMPRKTTSSAPLVCADGGRSPRNCRRNFRRRRGRERSACSSAPGTTSAGGKASHLRPRRRRQVACLGRVFVGREPGDHGRSPRQPTSRPGAPASSCAPARAGQEGPARRLRQCAQQPFRTSVRCRPTAARRSLRFEFAHAGVFLRRSRLAAQEARLVASNSMTNDFGISVGLGRRQPGDRRRAFQRHHDRPRHPERARFPATGASSSGPADARRLRRRGTNWFGRSVGLSADRSLAISSARDSMRAPFTALTRKRPRFTFESNDDPVADRRGLPITLLRRRRLLQHGVQQQKYQRLPGLLHLGRRRAVDADLHAAARWPHLPPQRRRICTWWKRDLRRIARLSRRRAHGRRHALPRRHPGGCDLAADLHGYFRRVPARYRPSGGRRM